MRSKNSMITALCLISPLSIAGTMGAVCETEPAVASCKHSAWDLSGQALYLQANSSVYQGSAKMNANGSSVSLGVDDPWSWGFKLEGAYHFGTSNDLDINWYHYRANNNKTYGHQELNYTYPTPSTTINATYNSNYASVNPQWDQVNIEYGQTLDIGIHKSLRIHGGTQYSRVANQTSYIVNGSFAAFGQKQSNNERLSANVSYNGFGPRLGADIGYAWDAGFNFYVKAALGLLAGTAKSEFLGDTVISLNYSREVVVPEVDGKLGISYAYPTSYGKLMADAGWLWVNYFNPIISINTPQSLTNQYTNFGIQGLYFGLKWMGDIE